MINERYKTLIEKLITGTRNKNIKWEQTSSESKFKVKIGLGSITIEKIIYWDINGVPYNELCKLNIINDEGIDADTICIENDSNNQKDYNLLLELYEIAGDSSLKISDTVQSILDELDRLDESFQYSYQIEKQ